MLSNFCEDKNINLDILNFHEEELQKINIPEWINIDCPFCKKELPLRSIRSIAMKLNARNMGDIAIEVYCDYCSKMDTLYFRNQFNTISDFIQFLEGEKSPTVEPIIEEEMYKMQYNNVVEKMIYYDKQRKT
jgi:hypothetical protein